jgi:hypothetical protein
MATKNMEKTKHLEFIQSVINRMGHNSFLLKGWAITIVGGLLALSFKELNHRYLFVALAVLFFFWLLDSYFLSRERLFIKLYDHVRTQRGGQSDFSMDTKPFEHRFAWLRCAISRTMRLFYGGLLVVQLAVLLII